MENTRSAKRPWYAGKNSDALFYLLIAIFFVELIIGGVAFFYGIMHAAPETPGGPPMARFPWLVWGICALLCPVALLLLVHLGGTWLSGALEREEAPADKDAEYMPEGMKRFYAMVRNAPLVLVLTGILLLGAALFFIDGAFGALAEAFHSLLPYTPWICTSIGSLLAVCFLVHAIMVYRQRKMEQEYAWRREVLQKTGIVLLDRKSIAIGDNGRIASPDALPQKALQRGASTDAQVLDVEGHSLPPSQDAP